MAPDMLKKQVFRNLAHTRDVPLEMTVLFLLGTTTDAPIIPLVACTPKRSNEGPLNPTVTQLE
jgi:hypothetical protein